MTPQESSNDIKNLNSQKLRETEREANKTQRSAENERKKSAKKSEKAMKRASQSQKTWSRRAEAKAAEKPINRQKTLGGSGKTFSQMMTRPQRAGEKNKVCVRVRSLAKGKRGGTVKHAQNHNTREHVTDPDHIDPSRSDQNLCIYQRPIVIGRDENGQNIKVAHTAEEIISEWKRSGILDQSRTKCEGVEMLLSISPDIWDRCNPDDRKALKEALGKEVKKFIENHHTLHRARLCSIYLHDDEYEAAPTIKAILIPPLEDYKTRGPTGAKSGGKIKQTELREWIPNKDATIEERIKKTKGTGRFVKVKDESGNFVMTNKKEIRRVALFPDGPKSMSDIQTAFANHLRQAGFGVKRGNVQTVGYKRKHQHSKIWKQKRALLAEGLEQETNHNLKILDETEKKLTQTEKELNEKKELIEKLNQEIEKKEKEKANLINKVDEAIKEIEEEKANQKQNFREQVSKKVEEVTDKFEKNLNQICEGIKNSKIKADALKAKTEKENEFLKWAGIKREEEKQRQKMSKTERHLRDLQQPTHQSPKRKRPKLG